MTYLELITLLTMRGDDDRVGRMREWQEPPYARKYLEAMEARQAAEAESLRLVAAAVAAYAPTDPRMR